MNRLKITICIIGLISTNISHCFGDYEFLIRAISSGCWGFFLGSCLNEAKTWKYNPKIPEYTPTFEEIGKQMRINVDILKQEITDHVDKEIARLKKGND